MRKALIYILLLVGTVAFAQQERSMARKGNRFYADSAFAEAEIAYRRSLDTNPDLREAQFNLANTALRQQKFDEAVEQLEVLASTTEDKTERGEIYHNIGNAYLGKYNESLQDQEKAQSAGEELDKSIEAFKNSLRNNPSDNETRYNLAVAQKLKEEGPQQEQQQQEQQQDQDKQDQEENQDKEDQEQQQQDQEQKDEEQQQDQEQQPQPEEISKEDAEKILNAMMQEEKELQEEQKEKQKAKIRSRQVEKDW